MNNELYQRLADASARYAPLWLITVIAVEGSTPVEAGAKMAVALDGSIIGSVGGGEIERLVIHRIVAEQPRSLQRWRYDLGLDHPDAEKTGMVCGGFQEMLIEPLFLGTPLFIVGGGHCGVALSAMAARTGFTVTVLDDREEWSSPGKHPGAARSVHISYSDIRAHLSPSPDTFVAIMTHGHKHDETVLRQLVRSDWRYLGMMGSSRKIAAVLRRMEADGFTRDELSRVYTPIGFPIGSHTPDEIAVSILAQMIAVRNNLPAQNANPLL